MEPSYPTNKTDTPLSSPISENNTLGQASSVHDNKKDDKYAQALASMALLDSKMQEKQQPEIKHFISKKTLIYIVLSLIVSIIGLFISRSILSGSGAEKTSNDDTVKQLIDTTKEVQDLKDQE